MKTIKTLLFFVTLLVSNVMLGQSKEEMIKEWQRAKAYTQEYLDAMPAEKYDLKPTPEMRSFAQQMLHFTDANYAFASAASGEKSPLGMGEAEKSTDQSKANVTKLVNASYDFVINAIGKMSDASFKETVKMFGRFEMTKGTALNKCFEHQTHHRGQTTVYIRLAGVKPPQEKLF